MLGREATRGGCAVGGVDLATLDPAAARAAVVVAPHEATLLSGTIRDNVRGAAGEGSRARAGGRRGEDVIEALPDGDARSSATRAARCPAASASGSRWPARSPPAPVLVLHDPTTALDAATEARVAGALRGARDGATTILVTTSPLLLAACDTVAVIRAGEAVALAPHAELVARDAAYREAVA